MAATVTERALGDIRWLIVEGERAEAFKALGRHAKREITEVAEDMFVGAGYPERLKRPEFIKRLSALDAASKDSYPDAWSELESLAIGAEVDPYHLIVLALRGDIGVAAHGCSELAWTDGKRTVLAHNEDGEPSLDGRCSLVTLRLDGEPAIATWWYPGFLVSNTFTVSEHGLVWGIDGIHVYDPPISPGHLFVARGLQQATSLDEAIEFLQTHPSAGGLTYVFGELGSNRVVTVEQAAGHCAVLEADPGTTCMWHTNHLRELDSSIDRGSDWSRWRGEVLSEVVAPPSADVDWLFGYLRTRPPVGVFADTAEVLTLSTLAADLTAETLTLVRHAEPVTVAIKEILEGAAD